MPDFKQVIWLSFFYGAFRDWYYIKDDNLTIYERKLLHYKNKATSVSYESISVVNSKTSFLGWLFSSWLFKWMNLGWGEITIETDSGKISLTHVHDYKKFHKQLMNKRQEYISRLYK